MIRFDGQSTLYKLNEFSLHHLHDFRLSIIKENAFVGFLEQLLFIKSVLLPETCLFIKKSQKRFPYSFLSFERLVLIKIVFNLNIVNFVFLVLSFYLFKPVYCLFEVFFISGGGHSEVLELFGFIQKTMQEGIVPILLSFKLFHYGSCDFGLFRIIVRRLLNLSYLIEQLRSVTLQPLGQLLHSLVEGLKLKRLSKFCVF